MLSLIVRTAHTAYSYLIGNERTLSLWPSPSLFLLALSFTLVSLCLQPPCFFWENKKQPTQKKLNLFLDFYSSLARFTGQNYSQLSSVHPLPLFTLTLGQFPSDWLPLTNVGGAAANSPETTTSTL